jgi:hypothetical protein
MRVRSRSQCPRRVSYELSSSGCGFESHSRHACVVLSVGSGLPTDSFTDALCSRISNTKHELNVAVTVTQEKRHLTNVCVQFFVVAIIFCDKNKLLIINQER